MARLETYKEVARQLVEQKESLDDVRSDVASCQSAITRTIGTIRKSLAGLKEEKQENARTLSFLKQNSTDKETVERDLRTGLSEKQGEIQRLSRDVAKAREDEKKAKGQLGEQRAKNAELERRLEESARSEMEARRRLSISETSSSSRKEVVSLSSLVEANKSEVDRLNEELELQAKSHSLRIAELQESFQAKIKELRRVHAEQMASGRSQIEDEIREKLASQSGDSLNQLRKENATMSEEIKAVRSELEKSKEHAKGLEKKIGENQRKETDARMQIHKAEKQNRTLQSELNGLKAAAKDSKDAGELESQNKLLAAELDKAKSELQARMKDDKGKKGKEDLSMLDIMEQQLVKLSSLLNSKEDEIEALKMTVERECLERGNLIAELSRLRTK